MPEASSRSGRLLSVSVSISTQRGWRRGGDGRGWAREGQREHDILAQGAREHEGAAQGQGRRRRPCCWVPPPFAFCDHMTTSSTSRITSHLVEGPNHILAQRVVHARLAAHARVHLAGCRAAGGQARRRKWRWSEGRRPRRREEPSRDRSAPARLVPQRWLRPPALAPAALAPLPYPHAAVGRHLHTALLNPQAPSVAAALPCPPAT